MTSDNPLPKDPAESPALPRSTAPPPRRIGSQDIFAGEQEVLIDHEGEIYRLRVTRNGKLILQK